LIDCITSRIARVKVLSFSLVIGRESLPPLVYRLFYNDMFEEDGGLA